jgi:hypothetical protein
MRRRRGHGVLVTLLVLMLGALAMIAAVAWMAGHLIVFAGVAVLMWGVFYLGSHEWTRARPGQTQPRQARPEEPAAAAALPAVTLPLAGDWDEPGTRQPARLQAGPDRARLLADPRSGAHPLGRSS